MKRVRIRSLITDTVSSVVPLLRDRGSERIEMQSTDKWQADYLTVRFETKI